MENKLPIDFRSLRVDISSAGNYFEALHALREYYQYNESDIIRHHEKGSMGHRVVYPCDWSQIFSPIEFQAWCVIRCKGNIPLYPQYPVGKYFLDFGNPYFKIGLELDGKKYHDEQKDKQRDTLLKEMGWRVFRISGAEMNRTKFEDGSGLFDSDDDYELAKDFEKLKDWIFHTGDGVIEAMKVQFFGGHIYGPAQFQDKFRFWCSRSLMSHNLIGEEIIPHGFDV